MITWKCESFRKTRRRWTTEHPDWGWSVKGAVRGRIVVAIELEGHTRVKEPWWDGWLILEVDGTRIVLVSLFWDEYVDERTPVEALDELSHRYEQLRDSIGMNVLTRT